MSEAIELRGTLEGLSARLAAEPGRYAELLAAEQALSHHELEERIDRSFDIDRVTIYRVLDWLTAQGVRFAPGGIRKGAAGHDICFLHPKSNEAFPIAGEGVLIELVQAPPAVITAFSNLV